MHLLKQSESKCEHSTLCSLHFQVTNAVKATGMVSGSLMDAGRF
jgi:hypothetical protein